MVKRTLSLLLCLIMVMSLVAPTVQASDMDDIYIEDGSVVTDQSSSISQQTDPIPTEPTQPEQEILSPMQASPVVDTTVSNQVTCDCDTEEEELIRHSDGCVLKRACIDLCAQSAMDIYNAWYTISTAERDFIKEYLSQHYPDTLDTLQKILNGDQIMDGSDEILQEYPQMTGEATAQVGEVVVDAQGVPEGSTLTVKDPTKKATNAVEKLVDDLGQNPEQLFSYDISVQNEESDDWQPQEGSVIMTLTIPGVKLHKHATVYVVHVNDDGVASTIEASVNEDGAITFSTEGFSTFAGFTVDFKYGDAFFSINGMTDIKLSQLFDELKMPLYASDVADLDFSDDTLVSITPLVDENDWLITSLKPFKTQECLTVTMNDGTVYEINVTDATAFIYVGGGGYGKGTKHDTDGNQICSWYADGDGDLSTQYGWYGQENDAWSNTNTIYVSGTGNFRIGILPYGNITSGRERAYIRLNQIRVGGTVELKVDLTDDFDDTDVTEVRLQAQSTANMFIIEDGASLKLLGRPPVKDSTGEVTKEACYLVLDGWSEELYADNASVTTKWGMNDYTKDNQLVQLTDGATGLICDYVRFQDAHRSAIRIANGENADSDYRLKKFQLTNCIFDSDVCRENTANNPATGSGGAIYLQDTGNRMNGVNHYTWMDEIKLENCQFNGCWAAESGGALGLYGRVRDITITNCQFVGTYAKRGYGGAITLAGHASTMTVTNTTFDMCSATAYGGAIYITSRVLSATYNTYSRLNELTITGCTFKNSGAIANGQTINASIGGGVCIDSSVNKVNVSSCTFTGTLATEGGGIAFGYTNFTVENASGEYAFMSNDYFTTVANATKAPPAEAGTDGSGYYRTTIGETTITDCNFNNVKAETQGGGIRFRSNSVVKSVSMNNVNFDGCEAVQAGSAVMMGDTIIPSFTYTNSIIQNCKTTMNSSDEVGGSFRTIGKTTCAARLTKIQFLNNTSHCSGGGLYWNAAGVRKILADSPITTAVAVEQCTFDGNKAGWYGGGIYCESVMTVSKCELKNNVSIMMGGGIAVQLYNNTVRPFTDNEITTLTLDDVTEIHHNQSKVGGGISIRANATLAIENSLPYKHTMQFVLGGAQVHHNHATTDGGGIWFNVESYDTSTESGAANQQEVERFTKTINLNSGSVYSNIAGRNGGGIFMNGGTVTDPENTATSGLTSNGDVTIYLSGAAVYDNEAGRATTGVTATAENVLPPVITVTKGEDGNILFTKAGATGGNGGGIYLYGNKGLCSITGGVIGATKNADGTPGTSMKNIATRSTDANVGGNGGGIAIFGNGRIEMEGGYVVNNTSDTAGGGIAVHDSSSMYLAGGTIQNNQAHMGGGISLNAAKAYKPDSKLEKDQFGIYLDGGVVEGNKATPDSVRGNVAYGGGICISAQSTAKINNGLIKNNTVASTTEENPTYAVNQEGGGVAVCEGSTVTFAGGTIESNHAYAGGGMVVRGASTVTMSGFLSVDKDKVNESTASGVIKNNYAYVDGGGVYLGPYKDHNVNKFTMTNGWIYNNEADHGWGGGVYVYTYNGFYLKGGYIDDNSANGHGGAIYANHAVVEVSNGVIQNNRSDTGSGGAIYASSQTEVKISNGVIQGNVAAQGGGGIYINTGDLSFSGNANAYGSVLNNKAPKGAGGGIYATLANVVDIDYLKVQGNSAKYGGGIFLEFCTNTTIDGGIFNKNYSNQGAGLFIRSGNTTITGGDFTYNVAGAPAKNADGTNLYDPDSAAQYGGGILIDHMNTTVQPDDAAVVDIKGGNISHNEAPYGGGVWIKNFFKADTTKTLTVNMRGGSIEHNTAIDGGGVSITGNDAVVAPTKTYLNIYGGDISENTANGKGGGVFATGLTDVQILEDTETNTHGTISNNNAYSGGGIAVVMGATLEVNNGYITYNKANTPETPPMTPAVSGYKDYAAIFGAGGGIFVARGISDIRPSSFTLEGNNMAIYGNEASFAADDVFSSGEHTELDMPLIQDMNLAGYGFSPEGWFEDYSPKDGNYASTDATGLNMLKANEAPNAISVQRYRSANAVQRRYAHIKSDLNGKNYVRGDEDTQDAATADYNYVNKLNAYVCMTLGIPAAADDTIVIDYGSKVIINAWQNDLFMEQEDFTMTTETGTDEQGNSVQIDVYHSYIGKTLASVGDKLMQKDGVFYSTSKPTTTVENGFGQQYFSEDSYGKLHNMGDGTFTYELLDMQMDKEDKFFYMVEHNGVWYYANITLVPATTVYYEDNATYVTDDDTVISFVKYHKPSSTTKEKLAEWEQIGMVNKGTQNEDRPGAAVMDGLDADNIYGYDGSYSDTSTYSEGSIRKVTVTRDPATLETTNARASFTFTGSGFDIISLCSKNTGIVMVSVFQGEVTDFENPPANSFVASYMVDTHYGYEYNDETGEWEFNENSSTTLYQVPVIKVDLTKVLMVQDDPSTPEDETQYKNYGHGTYTVEIYVAPSFLEREPGYWSADFYLDAIRIYNPAGIGDNISQTVLNAYKDDAEAWPAYAELRNMFISQKNLGESNTEGIIFIDGKGENITIKDYTYFGPNNEVYLNPGEHIAFTMDMKNYGQDVAGIHLALRGLTGKSSVLVQAGTGASDKTTVLDKDLSTTDMFYDIARDSSGEFIAAGKVMTITNDGDYPIAISNVKVTHGTKPTNNSRIAGIFQSNIMTSWVALDILSSDQLVDPIVTPKRPALSFNGMVCYNVFFTAQELGELTATDLGLAVFDTYDPEGTVMTAKEVLQGAVEIDGEYMVTTGGVHAKYLGDTRYFRAFAKKADGTYVYSKMVGYSALDYAKNALAKSHDVRLKQLVVAMLNYGAEAQKFFGYKTDDLMNKDLTADDQALLAGFDANSLNDAGNVDASKVGSFESTGGFTKKSPAISFKGAFEINYFFTPAHAVDGDMTLYFWNEDTYNSVTELTAQNADKVVVMTLENGTYTAASDEIPAKYLDKTVYVAAVYESNGVTYCSGVLPYSIAAYCQKPPAGVQALATAAAIYGCAAKQYFAV